MISYKYRLDKIVGIDGYIRQFNSVVRFAYNRFQDDPNLTLSEVYHIVKSRMQGIDLLDASLMNMGVNKAKGIVDSNVIFGGKANFIKRIKRKITHDEWKSNRDIPLFLRGSSSDPNGNRKANLNIIESNSIILKLSRETHINIQLPRLSKKHKTQLSILQLLCEEGKACFSLDVSLNSISIIFDENVLCIAQPTVIRDRILSFDMNPNFIGLSVIDWKSESDKTVIHKEIISFKDINALSHTKYQTNKRKHETLNASKYIVNLAKHYQCQIVVFEKLSIPSADKRKGKQFNKLTNNYWIRNALVSNIKKRCNLSAISFQEIVPQYSSFIGQIMNPDDYDSVAASIELSRRAYLFHKIFIDTSMASKPIVFPEFNIDQISFQWKDRLSDIPNNINSWKSLFEWTKKSKSSYRFLFSPNGEKFFNLFSRNNLSKRYIISCIQ